MASRSTPRSRKGGSQPVDVNEFWEELRSYVIPLYDEMDKLAKKAPSSTLSDLATKRVSRAIEDARALMADHDRYIAEMELFVPAGDNPEVRDAVLMLREIKQGLIRLNSKLQLQRQDTFGLR